MNKMMTTLLTLTLVAPIGGCKPPGGNLSPFASVTTSPAPAPPTVQSPACLDFLSNGDFGDVAVGSQSQQTISVVNPGVTTFIGTVSIEGQNPMYHVLKTTFSIKPGDTADVTIFFAPTVAGLRTATLVADSGGCRTTMTLTGMGR